MNNKSWGIETYAEGPIHVVLFVSRKKDNMNIENFKERRMSFITDKKIDDESLKIKFDEFVNRGLNGEMSRFYISVNERNMPRIKKDLIHLLIDEDLFNLCSIQSKIAGLAAKSENALTKHWLFDFDSKDSDKLVEFLDDLKKAINDDNNHITTRATPNGFAVITDYGFDSREICKKWEWEVDLKKDDLLCYTWKTKE